MKDGFVKVAAATPEIKVADCKYNSASIVDIITKAHSENVSLIVFPELCLTGYTCGDLFFQSVLIDGAINALKEVLCATEKKDMLVVVGLPIKTDGKLYNCAAVMYNGKLLGLVPKANIPCYNELSETRHFSAAKEYNTTYDFLGQAVPFGKNLLFRCTELKDFTFAVEICEDLWTVCPPSNSHAVNGARIIANLSASCETVGKAQYRRDLVKGQSARLISGYIYSSAGEGESTTDLVFTGQNIIAEKGAVLKENKPYTCGYIVSEIDVEKLSLERSKNTTFPAESSDGYEIINFSMPLKSTTLTRTVCPTPFIPADKEALETRCEEILDIQSAALRKRLTHSRAKTAVIGISGGLDSALALLASVRAMDSLSRPRTDIVAVTMPCFGTTSRTKTNARVLCEQLGVTFKEVDITASVKQHFADIGQDPNNHDVTFENAQARERTQVLMDIANKNGGLVIGTGDLSELALGWATYNGDHMSMYGVNASVPKTLVRHLVMHEALTTDDEKLKNALLDILDTPVSPELIPSKEGEISQKTEDIVGPYELHDFFLFYGIRWGFGPKKVFRFAQYVFKGIYDDETIKKWLKIFYSRFFAQQFKRSCVPDGPKVGSVSLSPRGDWHMPSDAIAALWLDEIEKI